MRSTTETALIPPLPYSETALACVRARPVVKEQLCLHHAVCVWETCLSDHLIYCITNEGLFLVQVNFLNYEPYWPPDISSKLLEQKVPQSQVNVRPALLCHETKFLDVKHD